MAEGVEEGGGWEGEERDRRGGSESGEGGGGAKGGEKERNEAGE